MMLVFWLVLRVLSNNNKKYSNKLYFKIVLKYCKLSLLTKVEMKIWNLNFKRQQQGHVV